MSNYLILHAKDYIDPDWLPTYLKQRDFLANQLVELNVKLLTLKRIDDFPLKVFFPMEDDTIFWRVTRRALIETSVQLVCRLFTDQTSGSLTMTKYKNSVARHPHPENPKAQKEIAERLKGVKEIIAELKNFGERATIIRDKVLAHNDFEWQIDSNSTTVVTFAELKQFLEAAKALFDALSFEIYVVLDYWGYSGHETKEIDIDRVLLAYVRTSHILNMPERNPDVWEDWLQESSPADLEIVNKYRRLTDLPEV